MMKSLNSNLLLCCIRSFSLQEWNLTKKSILRFHTPNPGRTNYHTDIIKLGVHRAAIQNHKAIHMTQDLQLQLEQPSSFLGIVRQEVSPCLDIFESWQNEYSCHRDYFHLQPQMLRDDIRESIPLFQRVLEVLLKDHVADKKRCGWYAWISSTHY